MKLTYPRTKCFFSVLLYMYFSYAYSTFWHRVNRRWCRCRCQCLFYEIHAWKTAVAPQFAARFWKCSINLITGLQIECVVQMNIVKCFGECYFAAAPSLWQQNVFHYSQMKKLVLVVISYMPYRRICICSWFIDYRRHFPYFPRTEVELLSLFQGNPL